MKADDPVVAVESSRLRLVVLVEAGAVEGAGRCAVVDVVSVAVGVGAVSAWSSEMPAFSRCLVVEVASSSLVLLVSPTIICLL